MSGSGSTSRHSLLIFERGLYVWGYNYYGQLGLGDTANRTTPQKLKFKTPISLMSCGYNHSMILDKKGNVWAWGNNVNGEIGVGDTTHRTTPQKVDLSCVGASIVTIACGANHSVVLDENGEVWCWGYNEQGQLGLGDNTNRLKPQKLEIDTIITAIACGGCHSVLLDKNGEIWVFGFNGNGELGVGNTINSSKPQKVNVGDVICSIACGYNHTIALNKKGKVWIWGYNDYGQLGLGDTDKRLTPQPLPFDLAVKGLGGGGLYTLLLDERGELWSCGHNGSGELGLGDTRNRNNPTKIENLTNINAIACYYNHTLAIDTKGELWVWGKNEAGQLGIGDTYPLHTSPKKLNIKGWLFIKKKKSKILFGLPERSPNTSPDLILKTKDQEIFYLHKAVIGLRCPCLLETEKRDEFLSFCESSTLKLFIDYIYENSLPENDTISLFEIAKLLIFCKKFQNNELLSVCQNLVIKLISNENIFELVEFFSAEKNKNEVSLDLEIDWCIAYCGSKHIIPSIKILKLFSDDFGEKILKEYENPTMPWPPKLKLIKSTQSVASTLTQLYKTKEFSDFKVLVKDSVFEVHQCILCKWEYFKILLMGAQNGQVEHKTEMPVSTFGKLIGYLYTGSTEQLAFDTSDCAWIISLAGYYLLQNQKNLLNYCNEVINTKFGPENWFEFLKIGIELESEEIQNNALDVSPNFLERKRLLICCKNILDGKLESENWLDYLQIGIESQNLELQEKSMNIAPASVDAEIKAFIQKHLTRCYQQSQNLKKLEEENENLNQKYEKTRSVLQEQLDKTATKVNEYSEDDVEFGDSD